MIILKKLKWDNCFSYGEDNEIDLDKSTLTQLVGTNGVGKSSIPLILEEVLFNKNSKNVKKADIANRYINSGYNISLSFSVDDEEYCIDVMRRAALKCKLTKNGEDISSHTASNTYKTLGEILGIDFKTFSQLVYQNTNASLQFLTATDTNRKKFLIDLLKLDEYVSYFEIFKEAVRIKANEITGTNAKIATIQKWLDDNILEDTSILEKLILPNINEVDEEELRSLQLEFENISQKNKKINLNETLKEQLKGIPLEQYKEDLQTCPELQDTSMIEQEIGETNFTITHHEKLVTQYENETGQCPTCGQDIETSSTEEQVLIHKEAVKNAKLTFLEKKAELSRIQHANKIHREATRGVEEWEQIFRSIDHEFPTRAVDGNAVAEQIKNLRQKITDSRSTLQEVVNENEKRERHNTRVGIILEQTQQFQSELDESQSKLEGAESKLAILETLKKAFSTNGLLAYKIESLVKELELLTNEYLAEFSDGRFSINFVVENDKLNVEVSDNGNIIDILALSSGELARVNVATLVAIRKLMASISRSQINVLFLDEVNQALDEVGKEKVVEVLLKEENLNTYMVSHGWTHPLLEKIEIIKEDNISYLEG
jgi:DNA repair exonuclease SbcCD ATPase subunit